MYNSKTILVSGTRLVMVVVVAVTVGCSSMEPYTVDNEAEGMKPGSGLLTGETGEKTIFKIPATFLLMTGS